jgi:hypothetical protein
MLKIRVRFDFVSLEILIHHEDIQTRQSYPVRSKFCPLSRRHLERMSIGGEQTEGHNDEQQSKVTVGGEQTAGEQFENLGGEQIEQGGEQTRGGQLRGEQVERRGVSKR